MTDDLSTSLGHKIAAYFESSIVCTEGEPGVFSMQGRGCVNSFDLGSVFRLGLIFLFLAGSSVNTGCSLQTRRDIVQPPAADQTRGGGRPDSFPPTSATSGPSAEDQGASALPGGGGSGAPAPTTPSGGETFLNKELPKIGLILGPGGLKTYAHIGVLREFARSRVPIHAVAGLEWGAMMAAFFAEKGQANDVDWKAFRLKESDLPSSGMLRGYRPKPVSDFDSFLSTVFSGSSAGISAEKAKVPFGCPTVSGRDRLQILSRGSLKETLLRCIPYPPLIGESPNLAAAFSVEESAQWLRSQGANLIVFVNVLGSGEPLSSKLAADQYGTSVLWTEGRRSLLRLRAPTVQWIVSVNTQNQKIDDFGARRASVEAGSRAALDLTQKLSRQYGF